MLSWARVCLNNPTSFIVAGKTVSSFINTCMCAHSDTRMFGPDCGNQAVSTSPSVRTRGMRADKRKKEKEIKQQKTCSFSAAAIL